jgi:large subunit ribosomal protein L4
MSNLTVDVIDAEGNAAGSAELPAELFDVQTNVPLIHQVVVAQLAAARQGTHATKTRGMVRGGGKKPYRQKGTGRARQGSTRAPQFAGGGTVHGPQPRDYAQRTPKKMIAAAMRGALSDRARHGRVHVLSSLLGDDAAPSTKTAVSSAKSLRNVADVHVITCDQLNAYDILCSDDVVFTSSALQALISRGRAAAKVNVQKPVETNQPAETNEAEGDK